MMGNHVRWLLGIMLLAASSAQADPVSPSQTLADEQLLKSTGIGSDGAQLLKFFRKRTPGEYVLAGRLEDDGSNRAVEVRGADLARIEGHIASLKDHSFWVREQAANELIAIGLPALAALRQALQEDDFEVQQRAGDCIRAIAHGPGPVLPAAAVRLLRHRKPEGACGVLLGYVPFVDNEAVEEEVLLALQALGVRDGKADPVLLSGLRGQDPERRSAAALVVGRSGSAEQRVTVRRLLTDPDAKVRLRAAQGLLAGRDPSGVPVLVSLLGEGPMEVARQAEDVLGRLAGEQSPRVDLDAPEKVRKRCREAWGAWWRGNKDRLDLARASDLVVFNSSGRAADVAERFLRAYMNGEPDILHAVTDIPFCDLDAGRMVRTRVGLNRVLEGAISYNMPGGQSPMFVIQNVFTLNQFIRTVPAQRRALLSKLPRPEVRVVLVQIVLGDDDDTESGILFIRVNNTQSRVVGAASGEGMRRSQ